MLVYTPMSYSFDGTAPSVPTGAPRFVGPVVSIDDGVSFDGWQQPDGSGASSVLYRPAPGAEVTDVTCRLRPGPTAYAVVCPD